MSPPRKERYHTAADYLSGSEQQMLAVARALSGNVRRRLLDEPVEGPAPAMVDRVFALEHGAVFHEGPAEPPFNDLDDRKEILWL